MSALIVLAAGGTGGHMFPAEALAGELVGRGVKVALVTDKRGQAFGNRLPSVALHRIRAGRPGTGIASKLVAVCEIALGLFAARRILRALAPTAAVGFGGYPSIPTMMAATRLGVPTVIHEQNARLGRANRWLAPRMKRIATSFAQVDGLGRIDRTRIVETGNPVRPAVAAERAMPYVPPVAGPINLFIIGGSQGAHILSAVVPSALALLPAEFKDRLSVAQQARPEDIDAVRGAYGANHIHAEVATFFADAPARMARAHLVIARAGASSVAELCVIGRPVILVPYRHAADDHQTTNAEALGAVGAAWVMSEQTFTASALAQRLANLFARPELLAAAAASAQRQGRPDAAQRLADLVLEIAGDAP
ncbi:MAG: undecaprenyldiphospho-muramoylpentapeptide beta-N-acetylglucosaminyltransferase [Alphaproteobacteria bacterium]|nr:undecaprenyldiphospho-muramoylpentapeptide beta-N-acetylglucosaminyltransferase [Alphaproteobacteria bacterium]